MAKFNINIQSYLQSPSLSNINAFYKNIAKKTKDIFVDVQVNSKDAVKDLRSYTTESDRATKSTQGLTKAIELAAKRFVAYTIAASSITRILITTGNAVSSAIKFETELSKLAQTIDKSNDFAKQYSKSLLEISVNYGLSSVKVAETARVLAQAGFESDKLLRATELLAKTTLLSTFDSINDSTEALIVLTQAFGHDLRQLELDFSDINLASKKYAVESQDLITALSKTGGVFAATGGSVKELIALITTVRETTRESADTISTGFRTIFSRLQRPKTVEFFKRMNIELEDTQGRFIGNFEAIQKISEGLQKLGITPGDIRFAEIVEETGGLRQVAKVIPLLTKAANSQAKLNELNEAGNTIDKDVLVAKERLAFQLDALFKNFDRLINEIYGSDAFQYLARSMVDVANSTVEAIRQFKLLFSILIPFAGVKTLFHLSRAGGIGSTIRGFNSGGFVPGKGNSDTVPAMLTPGEFVVNKQSARIFGYSRLARINKFAKGGPVGTPFPMRNERIVPVTDINQAVQIVQNILSKLGTTMEDLGLTITEMTEKQQARALKQHGFRPAGVQSGRGIGLDFSVADSDTVAHELGHFFDRILDAVDIEKYGSTNKGGLASTIPTSNNAMIARLYRSQREEKYSGKRLDPQMRSYITKPQELFADLFAKTTDDIRSVMAAAIISSQTHVEQRLSEYGIVPAPKPLTIAPNKSLPDLSLMPTRRLESKTPTKVQVERIAPQPVKQLGALIPYVAPPNNETAGPSMVRPDVIYGKGPPQKRLGYTRYSPRQIPRLPYYPPPPGPDDRIPMQRGTPEGSVIPMGGPISLGSILSSGLNDFVSTIALFGGAGLVLNSFIKNTEYADTYLGKFGLEIANVAQELAIFAGIVKGVSTVQRLISPSTSGSSGFMDALGNIAIALGGKLGKFGSYIAKIIPTLSRFASAIVSVWGVLAIGLALISNRNNKLEQETATSGSSDVAIAAQSRGSLRNELYGLSSIVPNMVSGFGRVISLFGLIPRVGDAFNYLSKGIENAEVWVARFAGLIPSLNVSLAQSQQLFDERTGRTSIDKFRETSSSVFGGGDIARNALLGARALSMSDSEETRSEGTQAFSDIVSQSTQGLQNLRNKVIVAGGSFQDYIRLIELTTQAETKSLNAGSRFANAVASSEKELNDFNAAVVNANIAGVQEINRRFVEISISANKLNREFLALSDKVENSKFASDAADRTLSGRNTATTIARSLGISKLGGSLSDIVNSGSGGRLINQAGLIGNETGRAARDLVNLSAVSRNLINPSVVNAIQASKLQQSEADQVDSISSIISQSIGGTDKFSKGIGLEIDNLIKGIARDIQKSDEEVNAQAIYDSFNKKVEELFGDKIQRQVTQLNDSQVQGLLELESKYATLNDRRISNAQLLSDIENDYFGRFKQISDARQDLLDRVFTDGRQATSLSSSANSTRNLINSRLSAFGQGPISGVGDLFNRSAAMRNSTPANMNEQNRSVAILKEFNRSLESVIGLEQDRIKVSEKQLERTQRLSEAQAQLAQSFAFGTRSERRDIMQGMQAFNTAATTGNIDAIPDRLKAQVESLLTQFSGTDLKFGPRQETADQLRGRLVSNSLQRNFGLTAEQASAVGGKIATGASPAEKAIINQINESYNRIQTVMNEQRKNDLAIANMEIRNTNNFAQAVDHFSSTVRQLFVSGGDGGPTPLERSIGTLERVLANPIKIEVGNVPVTVSIQGLQEGLLKEVEKLVVEKTGNMLRNYDRSKANDPNRPAG